MFHATNGVIQTLRSNIDYLF